MKAIKAQRVKLKTKRTFIKKGTCSRTFFHILNRENGYPLEDEEQAIDPLAGGINQQGYQCGMLWGASMAAGAEAHRRSENQAQAIGKAILATQTIMESFLKRAKSIECEAITSCDWSSKKSLVKYFLSGKFVYCYKLAGKWAPDAIEAANGGLSLDQTELNQKPKSCASELIKKMGGSDEEMLLVAGFAGGLGLSGNGCGALAAAIWMNTLSRIREKKYKAAMSDPIIEKIISDFYEITDYEMECNKICGQRFKTIDDHSEFIENGGCNKLIDALAKL